MIHKHPWGATIDIIRRDGHRQVYRIVKGCECGAVHEILVARQFGRLDDREAGLLLSGVAQLLPKRESGFDRLVRLFCEVLGLGDEAECSVK